MGGVSAYLGVRLLLSFCFYILASPIAIAAIYFRQYAMGHAAFKNFQGLAVIVGLFYVIGIPWFASKTAKHVVFEQRGVGDATKLAFGEIRFTLSFLPIAGHLFAGRENESKDNDEA